MLASAAPWHSHSWLCPDSPPGLFVLLHSHRSAILVLDTNWQEPMTAKYEIIIYWSQEDQAFIAEVPELSGCAADGKTYQEALANVEVIIREWIETAKELGRPIPAPKGRLVFA